MPPTWGGTGSAASCPGHWPGAKAWASRCTEPVQWANETPELHVDCRQKRGSGWPASPKPDSAGGQAVTRSEAVPHRCGLDYGRLMACQSGLDGTQTTMRGGKNALASGDRWALNPKGTAALHGVLSPGGFPLCDFLYFPIPLLPFSVTFYKTRGHFKRMPALRQGPRNRGAPRRAARTPHRPVRRPYLGPGDREARSPVKKRPGPVRLRPRSPN